MALFKKRDVEQYTDSLAAYLPGGELFISKSVKDSNFRKLLRGMSGELFRANGLLIDYTNEIIPDQTNDFLSEWESAVGIPDLCFTGTGTNAERRRDILLKLAALGVQTEQDYIDLAAAFGVTITVTPAADIALFPMTFPIILFDTEVDARFTIVIGFDFPVEVTFPYTFPIPFGTPEIGIIQCVFEQLKPANCQLIFRQEP